MAPHENLFFVEKHYNDSLYRGQRKGTTHTDREIQAAANLLGRRGVVADERAAVAARRAREHHERVERVRASGESLTADGDVVILGMGGGGRAGATSGDDAGGGKRATREWDGCVARIDVANLAAGRHGTKMSKIGMDESSQPPGRRTVPKLDAGNRWKTEARIAAGGTGGCAELERARRAAHALDGGTDAGDGSTRRIQPSNHHDDDDDDAPVVVLPEDLEFGDDGWSRGAACLDGVRSGDLAVPRNAALEREISESAARAMERMDAEAFDRSAAQLAAAQLAERDAARRRKLAAALAERDVAAAGDGPAMSADSTHGKKKRTRKGLKKAHLLVSFGGDDDDEDASLGA